MEKLKKDLLFLIIAILIGISAYGCWNFYENTTYVTIDDVRYQRNVRELDLSGQEDPNIVGLTQLQKLQKLDLRGTKITCDDYDLLHTALPECEILWDIPFQGKFWDQTTTQLQIKKLSDTDLKDLSYFAALQRIDARECRDYEAIRVMKEQFPHCQVLYSVVLSGTPYPDSTTTLTLENGNTEELERALSLLPDLKSIHLTGNLPDSAWLKSVQEKNPQISLTWEYTLYEQVIPWDRLEIDLSGAYIGDPKTVEEFLPYFPKLNKLILCDCGISNEDMDALGKKYEDIRFVWNIYIGRCVVRTDATTFMPYKWGYTPDYPLRSSSFADLKYCTDMICMDLGHMVINDCSFLEYMPEMQYLLLADTEIRDITPLKHLKKLKYLELFMTYVRDISPLAECVSLEDVNLCYIQVSNLGALKDLPNLKNVWLVGGGYSYLEFRPLRDARPDVHFCTAADGSSTGFGWRELDNYYKQRDLLGMRYMTG